MHFNLRTHDSLLVVLRFNYDAHIQTYPFPTFNHFPADTLRYAVTLAFSGK